MTNVERVLAALTDGNEPLDDDEIAQRIGMESRQAVNKICRRLAVEGRLTRSLGPSGKIINTAVVLQSAAEGGTPSRDAHGVVPLGDSAAQRAAEPIMLGVLADRVGVPLGPRTFYHPAGTRVEVDGADEAASVLVECWAHRGTAKGGQKWKLVNDAAKLAWVHGWLPPADRELIICVSDGEAIRHLRGKSWQARAIEEMGVRFEIVDIPDALIASVVLAQERQYR